MISTTHTLDGVEVVPGLLVWDYDLRPRRVVQRHDTYRVSLGLPPEEDPWWEMEDPVTGTRGSDMNCSRMWVRHPSTGQRVKAPLTGEEQ